MARTAGGGQPSELDRTSAPSTRGQAPTTTPRPMRADALKNRKRILDAAEEIFATEGIAVAIDDVAERAGVGVGTVYRHFPNKESLFEAIVIERVSHLQEAARELSRGGEPGEALFDFLREIARHAASKRDLFDALTSAGIDIKSRCAETLDDMLRQVDLLVQQAVAARAIRDDLSTAEIVSLVVGTCHAGGESGIDAAGLQRMVGVVLDGLRPVSRALPSSPGSSPAVTR